AIYQDTVNDPTTFPPSKNSHRFHRWTLCLLAGLVRCLFLTSGSPTPLLDGLLGISLIVHSRRVRNLYKSPSFDLCIYSARGIQFDTILVD
ncbi:hypothetical protein DFH94DRAFT_638313, partial [Russula ochroleuca]